MLRPIFAFFLLLSLSASVSAQSLVTIYSQNFNAGGGGWTPATTGTPDNSQPWTHGAGGVGGTGGWQTNGFDSPAGGPFFQTLTSPVINVPYTAPATLSFDHLYNFEFDGTVWDGGVVMISVNGSPFTQIPDSSFTQNSYNTTLQNSFIWGIPDQLNGLDVYGASSGGCWNVRTYVYGRSYLERMSLRHVPRCAISE